AHGQGGYGLWRLQTAGGTGRVDGLAEPAADRYPVIRGRRPDRHCAVATGTRSRHANPLWPLSGGRGIAGDAVGRSARPLVFRADGTVTVTGSGRGSSLWQEQTDER